MPFVSDEDVQAHLPADKLVVEEIPDDKDKIYLAVERIVRGYLVDVVDSTTLASWVDAASTPDIVEECAALLTAAEVYRIRFSEQGFDDPMRAQVLYNQGMTLLEKLQSGVVPIDGVDSATGFDSSFFAPNDASTDAPKFTMSGRF